jgi:hypothetical protein
MHPLRKKVSVWLGIVALTITLGSRAHAAIYECAFALDRDTISKLSDKHVIKVKDAVYHKTFTLDLGSATLTTLRPGDVVMAHGEAHIVLEINQRTQWVQFILVDREDIDRFTDLLPSQ